MTLSSNMVTAKFPEDDEDIIETHKAEPWAQRIDTQRELRFEQREPPIEDQLDQIDVRDEASPRPIFISQSLFEADKQELIQLIR